MSYTLSLRRASSRADRRDIDYLQRLTLPNDDPCDLSDGVWWIVREGAVPAAFGGITISHQWIDCMYLCRSGVAYAYRGQGLQKRLILVREKYAASQGMNWVVTDTTENPASSNNLIARGFQLFEPSQPWAGEKSLYWRKRLAQEP